MPAVLTMLRQLSGREPECSVSPDEAVAWGVIAKITMAPGVYIIPELIFQDNKDQTNDAVVTEQGDATIFGVFWRIDFK